MAHKKGHERIFTQADFLLENGFHDKRAKIGLAILSDIQLSDYDNIRTNFRSDFTSIILVQKGEIKGMLNRTAFTVKENELLLVSPNTLKKLIYVDKNSVVSGLNFTLDFLVEIGVPTNKMELYDYFTSKYSPHWKLTKEDAAILTAHFQRLSIRSDNLLDEQPFSRELLHHTFFLFLYELAAMSTKYTELKNPNISRKESLVISFSNLVHLEFRHQRNVQQYAEQLFVTPKYLTETVKEITGKSAGEVIDDIVMLEAKVLLEDTRLSIAEVAEMLHFSDQSFFGKYFKRHSGVSPREFRLVNK
ncbi:helix-turn-helix transcriptional regulator [Chitinophaga sp. 212800010-3]|uniref:helix-turn-helix domain-containing protein n=1 Tax=unclassified Chitinophaga TaxID=2619133 RepID=UPI002DF63C7B|nr:AraC family transcriptional regulator [Chitinophaga sp. 212800010-3]